MIEEPSEQELKAKREAAISRIESLGSTLSKSRDEAVEARAQSGIEDDWLEDEESYEGIDDANRDIYRNRSKPLSPEGGSDRSRPSELRSRVFLNITRPYVDAAAAKVADMLLPTDEQNWALEETPIPDMLKSAQDNSPLINPDGSPVVQMLPGPDGQPTQKQMTVADQAKMILDKAKDAAKAAEKRIDDWLAECNYNSEVRKVIEDCARLGVGVMKGPYPVMQKRTRISKSGGLTQVEEETLLVPESRCISPWNLYPDPNCGADIHRGTHIWEKDRISKRMLQDLLDDPSYIQETIEMCLAEGPQKKEMDKPSIEKGEGSLESKDQFDIWYYTGYIDQEDMEAAGCGCLDRQVPAVVVMVNDHVIKAAINPLDSGEFPYDVMVWQRRSDYWAGVGVGRQMRASQRMLNAATRNMMDNAGLSAGPQLVMRRSVVEPADGKWEFSPRKVWYVLEDAEGSVNEAFAAINIPSMQQELINIIQLAQKMAEDTTGLPMLMQGQQGAAPETVGGMQMLNNNASTVMRRIARTFDDMVTEPHIRRYYEWLLLYGEDEAEKGDYKIIARGSSALVERDIQNQTIAQMGAMVVNPAFGIDPKRWVAEYFKSQRLDPRNFQYTEEEMQQMAEAAAQAPQQDPNQVRAEAMIQTANIRANAELQKATLVQNSDVQELNLKAQEANLERQHQRELAQMSYQMKLMEFAEKRNLSLEQLKAQLAEVAMKEKNKREIYQDEANLRRQTGQGI